jgi:peptide/histidine transporter 3/4
MANKLWTVCIFILVVEIAERLCYYSISGSQRNFLTDFPTSYGQGEAGAINSVFTMLSYLSCFLGGYLADQWLGRYKTILIFASCYFGGTVMVAASSTPNAINIPVYLAGCLFFISLGTGAIKPNVMTFGAAQYDETDPIERAQQKTFFSYFYLMINVGAGISFGFLINITTSEATSTSLGWGFFKVYCIAAAAMGLAVLAFLPAHAGTKRSHPQCTNQ